MKKSATCFGDGKACWYGGVAMLGLLTMNGDLVDRLETQLEDGTLVGVRPLRPSDRASLAEGYRRLSPDSRYQRFWVRTGEVIGEGMLDRFLSEDVDNHSVWAVLDREREFPGLGAGSFWRSEAQSEEAEFHAQFLMMISGVESVLCFSLSYGCRHSVRESGDSSATPCRRT